MRYKILFYFFLILEICRSTIVIGGENEPEAWPASSSCSHIVSDITTLGSIVTGGLAAVDAIRGTPDGELGMSIATIALVGVATVARGCADYFDTKTTPACCRNFAECGVVLGECGDCCGNLWCCNFHSQAKYKQWSERWKIPGYLFYAGSLACNAASIYYTHGYEPAPVLDILAVLSTTAAIFSNKNTFRYISKYYRERIARIHLIKLLGKELPLPLPANHVRSSTGVNSPLLGVNDALPTREEYSQNTGLYHYLLWEQPIREVREYFIKLRVEVPDDVINPEDFLNNAPANPTIDRTKISSRILSILCALADNQPQDWNGITAQQMNTKLPQGLGNMPNVSPVLVQLTGLPAGNLPNTAAVTIINRLLQSLANKEVNDLGQSRGLLIGIPQNAQDKPFANQLMSLIDLHVSFLNTMWTQIDIVRRNLGNPDWFDFNRVNHPYEAKIFIAQTKKELLSNRRGGTADHEANLIEETHNPLLV